MEVNKIQGPNIQPPSAEKTPKSSDSKPGIPKKLEPESFGPSQTRATSATLAMAPAPAAVKGTTLAPQEEFSFNELALMVLLELEPQDYQKLKELCALKKEDEINLLVQKILESSEKSEVIQKARENIVQYQKYLEYKNEISGAIFRKSKIYQKEIDRKINQLLSGSFAEALKVARPQKVYQEYFSILDKYQIKDPLNISLDELRKKGLNIYEETILKNQTEAIKILSLSYLSFEELEKFLDFIKNKGDYENTFLSQYMESFQAISAARLKSLGLSGDNFSKLTKALFRNPGEESLILKPEIRQNLSEVLGALIKEKVISEEFRKDLEAVLKELFLRRDYVLIRQREVVSEKILEREDFAPKFIAQNLTAQAKNIISRYIDAVLKLDKALATSEPEDDEVVSRKLAQIKEELMKEIEGEYQEAFVKTPSEPEKQALKNLLLALAQLRITDERIVYYSRLSNQFLKDDERTEISRLRAADSSSEQKNKSRTFLLERYQQVSKEFFKNYSDYLAQRLTERKSEHGNALSYALPATGIPEAELLKIDAALAEKYLSPDIKKIIDSKEDNQKKINFCLAKIKEINELLSKENIGQAELKKYSLDYDCLCAILYRLVGSSEMANYLIQTKVFDVKEGARIITQFWEAQYTPEKTDDFMMQENLQKFHKLFPAVGVFNDLELLRIHILSRKILKEPVDEAFVDSILNSLAGYDKQYDIEGFHKLLQAYFFADANEFTVKEKSQTNEAREKLLNWLKNFIQNIRNKVQENPDYASSEKMGVELEILGRFLTTIFEMKIIDEEEYGRFSLQNPLVPETNNFSLKALEKGQVFHTTGYQGLPEEIRQLIEKGGQKNFCEQNSHLLNIYWVPYENTNFGGYAPHDKNTIVITYDKTQIDKIKLAVILIHELMHKVDFEAIRKYQKQNPKDSEFVSNAPSLITERNAYLAYINFLNALSLSEHQLKEMGELAIKTANFLLGFKEDDRHFLQPPFAEIDLFSPILLINPAEILPQDLQMLSNVIDQLGYKDKEKKYLLECWTDIFLGGFLDLNSFSLIDRNLFIDFLGKLINYEKTDDRGKIFTSKTGGFVNEDLLLIIKGIRQSVQEKLSKILQENIQKLQNPAISDDEKQILERQNQELEQQIKILKESPATLIPREIFRLILLSYYDRQSHPPAVKK